MIPTSKLGAGDESAAADLVVAADDAGYGFGVGLVLFNQDSLGERVGVVGFEDGDGALENDWAVIEMFIDKMDGAAGYFYAVVKGLPLGFQAGKSGE